MTYYSNRQVTCALCGHVSHTTSLESTNSIGSPDLDLRPPEMRRSTIDSWIQRCSHCGYCAPDIQRDEFQPAALVDDPLYNKTLRDLDLPPKAREFLCWSLIAAHARRFDVAAWARINADWICDDVGDRSAATGCRALAIDSIESGKRRNHGLSLSLSPSPARPPRPAHTHADDLMKPVRVFAARLNL